jgi:hypothetical protein
VATNLTVASSSAVLVGNAVEVLAAAPDTLLAHSVSADQLILSTPVGLFSFTRSPSSTYPTYQTGAAANPGVTGGTGAIAPAVAFALASDTTVAALLAGSVGSSTSPAGNVYVHASPAALSSSCANGNSGCSAPGGFAAQTSVGPVALTVAVDTTLATSLASVHAASLDVLALGSPVSSARSFASSAGVSVSGRPSTDSQVQGWLGAFGGLVSGGLPAVIPASSFVLPVPSSLVPPPLPVVPSAQAPDASGVDRPLGAGASIAVNVEVATTT